MLRSFLVILGSAVFSAAAAVSSALIAGRVAGRNISDLGVPMFANGGAAILFGVLLYAAAVGTSFWLARRVITRVSSGVWAVSGAVCLLVLWLLGGFLFLMFA